MTPTVTIFQRFVGWEITQHLKKVDGWGINNLEGERGTESKNHVSASLDV